MRVLVVVLVLANVGLFGWHFAERVDALVATGRAAPPPAPAGPTLTLLAELGELPPIRGAAGNEPAAASDDVDMTTELDATVAPSGICIDVGPFSVAAEAAAVAAWLQPRAAILHTEVEVINQRRLFWVYLEPVSDDAARAQLDALEAGGVEDIMLIHRGELKNAISLGLFSSQDSVNRRLAEMSEQGVKPVVVPRFENTDRTWIRANLSVGNEDPAALPAELLTATATVREIPCEAVSAPPSAIRSVALEPDRAAGDPLSSQQ